MSEEKKAWAEFARENRLDEHPLDVVNLVWAAWRRAFDTSREMASQSARKDEPADGNVRFIPKSDGTITGSFIAKEAQVYSSSAGDGKKTSQDNVSNKLVFGLALIALTISIAALITVVVHSIPQGV